jgi:hypothetical protein
MGLLDALNSDEGRLGLGLLAAGGYSATPISFGQRVQSAFQGQDAYKQNQQKSQLLDMQMKNFESEIDARKLAGVKDARQQALIASLFGPGGGGGLLGEPTSPGAFVPSADGMGPTMPPQMQQQARPSGLAGMTPDMVARLKLGGLDLTDIYKFSQEPQKFEAGSTYKDRNTGVERFIPKVGEGIAADVNGFYAPLPGYASAQGQIEGAKTGANEAAKSGFDLVKVVGPDGAERYVPRSTVLGSQSSTPRLPQAGGEAGMRVAAQGGMGADPMAIQREIQQTTADLAKVMDPASKAQLQAYLSDLQAQAERVPGNVGQTPGFQATPTTAQKLAGDAGGKINETWLKTSYEPVVASIGPTDDMLASVRVARNAITQMGGTGWGTETKAAAASVLNGLGLSAGNSKMLATSSQVFQNAAMERLQSVLNAAKGPQTEGDATRAMKTFGQLGNTTEANAFILDLTEAKAQRDKMKAAFYQQALPIAQKKGDLAEIDREWSQRSPSIFSLPGMTKWGIK